MSHKREKFIVSLILCAALAYVLWITNERILNFTTFFPLDSAVPSQVTYNISAGNGFTNTFAGKIDNSLSFHGCFILALFAPLFKIFPDGRLLYFIKEIFLLASAIPIYLLICECVPGSSVHRLILLLLYLASGFMVGFYESEIHLQLISLPFLIFAYYFYKHQRFSFFMMALVPCLLSKESYAFTTMMWSFIALLEKRSWKWILWPLVAGAAELIIYSLVSRHVVTSGELNLFHKYYGIWGDDLVSCMIGLLKMPDLVCRYLLRPSAWFYLFFVAFPFFPFLLMNKRLFLLCSANVVVIWLMSGRHNEMFHPGMFPYFMEVCVFSFIAFLEYFKSTQENPSSVSSYNVVTFIVSGIFLILVYFLKGYLSHYLLTGIKPISVQLISVSSIVLMIAVLLIHYAELRSKIFLLSMVMAFTVVLHFLFYFETNLTPERVLYQSKDHWERNRIAKTIIDSIPRTACLTVPSKYSIYCSAREWVYTYNGDVVYSDSEFPENHKPDYVFLDGVNYNTFLDAEVINQDWDRRFILDLIKDSSNWSVVSESHGLYLLRRKS